MNEWLGDQRKNLHGPGDNTGNSLGVYLPDTLGHQFTNHDRKVSNHHNHQHGGKVIAETRWHTHFLQPERERLSENGFSVNPRQEADVGNTDLNSGEKMSWIFR